MIPEPHHITSPSTCLHRNWLHL